MTAADEVEGLVASAVERFGGLDIMVNNAGITRDATMRKMAEEHFRRSSRSIHGGLERHPHCGVDHARERARRHREHVVVAGKVGNFGQTN